MIIPNLQPGWYVVTELTPPNGFQNTPQNNNNYNYSTSGSNVNAYYNGVGYYVNGGTVYYTYGGLTYYSVGSTPYYIDQSGYTRQGYSSDSNVYAYVTNGIVRYRIGGVIYYASGTSMYYVMNGSTYSGFPGGTYNNGTSSAYPQYYAANGVTHYVFNNYDYYASGSLPYYIYGGSVYQGNPPDSLVTFWYSNGIAYFRINGTTYYQNGGNNYYIMGGFTYSGFPSGTVNIYGPSGSNNNTNNSSASNYVTQNGSASGGYTLQGDASQNIQVTAGMNATVIFKDFRYATLSIKKTDQDGNPLANVPVSVTQDTGTYKGTYTTDSNGQILITDMTPGNYNILELSSLPGYADPSTTPKAVSLNWDDSKQVSIVNYKLSTVSFIKVDDSGNPMANISLSLLDSGKNVIDTGVTDTQGTLQFSGISAGTYYWAEAVPEGYSNSPFPTEFTVGWNETKTINITNHINTGQIHLMKTSAGNNNTTGQLDGDRVPGATYVIKNEDNVIVDTLTTDANGVRPDRV